MVCFLYQNDTVNDHSSTTASSSSSTRKKPSLLLISSSKKKKEKKSKVQNNPSRIRPESYPLTLLKKYHHLKVVSQGVHPSHNAHAPALNQQPNRTVEKLHHASQDGLIFNLVGPNNYQHSTQHYRYVW